MNKNKRIQQNRLTIKNFFLAHGEDTAKEMSKFLFQLQGTFFTQPDIDFTDEYKSLSVMHFEMLYNLINELQPVSK